MRFVFTVATLASAVFAAPGALDTRATCVHDATLNLFVAFGALAKDFCKVYEKAAHKPLPVFAAPWAAETAKIKSACSCILTTTTSTIPVSTTSIPASTTSVPVSVTSTTASSSETSTSEASTSETATSVVSTTSLATTTSDILSTTTSSVSESSTSTATPCTCTEYSQIAPAVAACTAITLQDIHAPTNSTIDLTKVKAGTVITFAGTTTFAFTNISSFDPITLGGKGITVQGAPGSIIDGNGPAYWDGIGSNGGVPKPNHFWVVSKLTANSVIQDLYIKNWPTHCFYINNCADLTIQRLTLDNSDGDAPNNRSNGLAAGHNSDGFDLSGTNNTLLTDSSVTNQDDCVAITSGNNVTVSNIYCSGGHGMSIGSVGGKSNNNVTNILFTDSSIVDSENGARIKTNFNTTGFISNITYSNIALSGITRYGIDLQQDYLNGGPTGSPSNGVIVSNILFQNITGTVDSTGKDYYVLCGDGSCSNVKFEDVAITGGGLESSCNYPPEGCPGP